MSKQFEGLNAVSKGGPVCLICGAHVTPPTPEKFSDVLEVPFGDTGLSMLYHAGCVNALTDEYVQSQEPVHKAETLMQRTARELREALEENRIQIKDVK